jgi:hypothetical protein
MSLNGRRSSTYVKLLLEGQSMPFNGNGTKCYLNMQIHIW